MLACIIFSVFASSSTVVNPDAAAASMVWSYIEELIFNMLVLVGSVKMADRIVREMMRLKKQLFMNFHYAVVFYEELECNIYSIVKETDAYAKH